MLTEPGGQKSWRIISREPTPAYGFRMGTTFTGLKVVHMIVTEMAVIDVTPDGLVLREIAAGLTLDQVKAATGAPLIVAGTLGTF